MFKGGIFGTCLWQCAERDVELIGPSVKVIANDDEAESGNNIWRRSPTPVEEFENDDEYPACVVSEEVDYWGQVKCAQFYSVN